MDSLVQFFASSQSLLLLCMGVSVSIGCVHLWMSRRFGDANTWVAGWTLFACVFLCARGVHLTTADPLTAEYAGKTSWAVGPFLVWTLVGIARTLNGRPVRRASVVLLAIACAWAALILPTNWFVLPVTATMEDPFGRTHLSVEARWPAIVLAVYMIVVLVHGARRLARSERLEPDERRVLIAGFGAYAVLGISAVATGVGWWSVPAMAEYGPFVVGLSLSYLLVHRRQRLEGRLEDLLSAQHIEQPLRHAQRLQSVGQLAAGIAHEINNPMAFVRANLAALDEEITTLRKASAGPDSSDRERQLDEMGALVEESREGVERTIAIAHDMREFAHSGDEHHHRIDLCEVLESCVRVAAIVARSEDRIHFRAGSPIPLVGARESLRQAFLSLLVNGLEATAPHGSVWLDARADGDRLVVDVRDDGPGVPEQIRDRLFDPFYSARPQGQGTGLGLYIAQQILASHGGEIRLRAAAEGGAHFEVELPTDRAGEAI